MRMDRELYRIGHFSNPSRSCNVVSFPESSLVFKAEARTF